MVKKMEVKGKRGKTYASGGFYSSFVVVQLVTVKWNNVSMIMGNLYIYCRLSMHDED